MGFDPFKNETGLLDNADVTVLEALFTRRADSFDHGQKLELHLTVMVEGDEGGEQVLFFGCGDGWDTLDDGATAVREDGKERGFHANTKVGTLWGTIVDLMADDKACDKVLRERVGQYETGPRDTRVWTGLKFHVDRETRKGGGEINDYEVLVASAFNGVEGEGAKKAGKASGAAKKASGAAKKAPAKPAEAAGGITPAIRTALDLIADESADHDSFMERAFAEVPEASSDEAVKAAVGEDGDVAGSIWADALVRYQAAVDAGEPIEGE